MSKRTRLTKQKFYAINRDLKVHGKVKDIAAVHSVSEETVRTVKRAKTWPRFEAMKKLKNEQRRPLEASKPIKAVAVQQSLGTDLEQLDKITREPANQIQPLPSEEVKIVTVQEWEYLNRKVGRLYSLIGTPKPTGLFGRLRGRN
ncbi:hypothetical protein NG701_07600 [Pseudarthrobacter sp. HLT3-5]|uniref:hypothetical protein n=1 Tax=Pseudarthrobacter cellobiosi TaxID=2953654 RepID=UPI00208F5632|nr:hypothetical protein [Pseudarthrobacter sp. HLT3-5]MCO4274293.1 hypothetical protein [Pseudarthrobacter sp. HLT3-5]